jgi:hypothetical protein
MSGLPVSKTNWGIPSGSAASNLMATRTCHKSALIDARWACMTYIILLLERAALMAEITFVDHDHLIDSGLSPAYRLSGMLNAPAWRKVFARSINHFGSLVPDDSSSSTDASPPAPHLIGKRCQVVCVRDGSKSIHWIAGSPLPAWVSGRERR